MKILFTFPGQGNQRPGMLGVIPHREAILAEARSVLGEEIVTLDSVEALRHTRAVQLCLLITGVAWARELQRQGSSRISSAGCRSAPFLPQSSPGRWISPAHCAWWRDAAI